MSRREAMRALESIEDNLSHIRDVTCDLPSTASSVAEDSLLLIPKLEEAIIERDDLIEVLKSIQGYISVWQDDVSGGLKPTPQSLDAAYAEIAAALGTKVRAA